MKGLITINDFPYNINDLKNACKNKKIIWKEHATQRLLQRKILRGIDKPLHVVCSFDGEYIHIITAYIPDTIKFYDDLKTRKEN